MKRYFRLIALALSLLLALGLLACAGNNPPEAGTEQNSPAEPSDYNGPDFFVSPDGDDTADGSEEHPFASVQRAMDAVAASDRSVAHTVTFHAGRYPVVHIDMKEEYGGTENAPVTYQTAGDGDVIFDASKPIRMNNFKSVGEDDPMYGRFDESVRGQIVVGDLAVEGFTKEEIGTLYSFGTYSTAKQYGEEYIGQNPSFFWNDTRMSLARYPNEGYAYTTGVSEDSSQYILKGDNTLGVGAPGGTVFFAPEVAERMANWQDPADAWIYGCFQFNWAEMSTPVTEINAEEGSVKMLFNSMYGYKEEGAETYFYNIPEELDAPGEYWIDRENLKIYAIPADDVTDGVINVVGALQKMFEGTVSYTTFDGITFEGSSDTVLALTGDYNTVQHCLIHNCDGYAITMNGVHNTVSRNEIKHMGRGGITVSGGDYETLTHSENLVENNYVHDFAEVQHTYQVGIKIDGVGNTMRHNEVAYTPHMAITGGGCENLIEWNYIHDVVLDSSDAGAFYMGGQWHPVGSVLQNNKFERIGSGDNRPKAIYLDDMCSSWTIRENLIIDCRGFALNFGGGRMITAVNNVVIDTTGVGSYLHYDARIRTAYLEEGRFTSKDDAIWHTMDHVPYQNEIYSEKYPLFARTNLYGDDNPDDPDFPINPAYSVVKDNIFCGKWDKWKILVDDEVKEYSEIGDYLYNENADRIFVEGTYELNKVGLRAGLDYTPVAVDGYGIEPLD